MLAAIRFLLKNLNLSLFLPVFPDGSGVSQSGSIQAVFESQEPRSDHWPDLCCIVDAGALSKGNMIAMSGRLRLMQGWIPFLVGLVIWGQDGLAQTGVDSAGELDAPVVAFVNVAVVSMRIEEVLQEQTVVTEGDRIVSVGPADAVSVPAGATVIHGSGLYLMPGLADMHVHVRVPFDDGPLYLDAGVTTVLSLGTRAASWNGERIAERERSRGLDFVGPSLYTVGPQIAGGESADLAERIVRKNFEYGFDFVKVHGDVSAEAFDRLHGVAKQLGIRVTGHGQRNRGMQTGLRPSPGPGPHRRVPVRGVQPQDARTQGIDRRGRACADRSVDYKRGLVGWGALASVT